MKQPTRYQIGAVISSLLAGADPEVALPAIEFMKEHAPEFYDALCWAVPDPESWLTDG